MRNKSIQMSNQFSFFTIVSREWTLHNHMVSMISCMMNLHVSFFFPSSPIFFLWWQPSQKKKWTSRHLIVCIQASMQSDTIDWNTKKKTSEHAKQTRMMYNRKEQRERSEERGTGERERTLIGSGLFFFHLYDEKKRRKRRRRRREQASRSLNKHNIFRRRCRLTSQTVSFAWTFFRFFPNGKKQPTWANSLTLTISSRSACIILLTLSFVIIVSSNYLIL